MRTHIDRLILLVQVDSIELLKKKQTYVYLPQVASELD